MPGRTVTATLDANVSGYVAAMGRAAAATKQFADKASSSISKNERHITNLSRGAGVAGLALAAGVGVAVKSYADFDSAVSGIAATGADARKNLQALRQAAIQAGADTKYSASEAAGGLEALAKANVSAKEALGGGLKGALDLAASGNLGVAESAEVAAKAMSQFKLQGKDVPHIADLLAAAAGKAVGEVSDMSAALTQVGLVANQSGLNIEETTGFLAAFAQEGQVGSDAGTSFKTMLQSLTPTSAEAKRKMAELGISAYDAQGNFIGLASFADNLQDSMRGLSQEQQNAALKTIFGSDAIRAATTLYNQGGEGIRKWTDQVNDSGYAAEVAAVKMDNLKGDLEVLRGSFETALIGLGEGGDGALRGLVQGLTQGVNAFVELDDKAKSAFLAVAGGVGVAALSAAAVGKLAIAANDARDAFKGLGISAKGATIMVAGATLALGLGALAYANWATKSAESKQRVDDFTQALQNQTDAIQENVTKVAAKQLQDAGALSAARGLGLSLDTITDAALGNAFAMSQVEAATADAFSVINTTAEYDTAAQKRIADAQVLQDAIKTTGGEYNRAVSDARDFEEATKGTTAAAQAAAPAYGQSAGALDKMANEAETAKQELDALVDSLFAAGDAAIGLSDAQIGYENAVAAATKAVKDNKKSTDLGTEAGRNQREALNRLASASHAYIEELVGQDASTKRVKGATKDARDEFVKAAIDMGRTKDQAEDLADKYGLIPEDVKTKVDAPGIDATKTKVDDLKTAYDSFHDKDVNLGLTLSSNYAEVKAEFDLKFPQSRASGGPIQNLSGKGRQKHDTELAMLRVDEHVWTPEEVDAAGGHGAMYRMRQAALRGELEGYALGGTVGRRLTLGIHAGDTPQIIDPAAWGRQAGAYMGAAAASTFKKQAQRTFGAATSASGGIGPIDVNNPRGKTTFRGGIFTNLGAANLQKAEQIAGVVIRVMQGGFRPTTSYSGTSHRGDALDSQADPALIRGLRKVGWASGDRTGLGNWASHAHSVPMPGHGFAGGSGVYQAQDYRRRGGASQSLRSPWGLASGGPIYGPGTGTSDSIPVWASNGEYMVNAKATSMFRPLLESINAQGLAAGGPVLARAQGADIYRLITALTNPLGAIARAVADVARTTREHDRLRNQVGQAERFLDRSQERRAELGRRVNRLDREARATKGVTRADRELKQARKELEEQDELIERREGAVKRALDASGAAKDRAKDAAQRLAQAQKELADSAQQVSQQFANQYQSTSTDVRDWVDLMRTGATDLTAFTRQLAQLRKAGLSETLVQQIIGLGAVAGGDVAAQIAAGGSGLVRQLNAATSGLQTAADALGYLAGTGRTRMATGGPVVGPGTGTSDSVAIAASNGEWVVPARAVPANRGYLEAITYGRSVVSHNYARSHYASGGMIHTGRPLIDMAAVRDGLAGMQVWVQSPLSGEYLRAEFRAVAGAEMDRKTSEARTAH